MRSMRSCVVKDDECPQYRIIKEVFDGNYPAEDIDKMSITSLGAFVLRLLRLTSTPGAKAVSSIGVKNNPKWWPSDVPKQQSFDNLDNRAETDARRYLRRLVIKCSDFYRENCKQQWLPSTKSLRNDENFNIVKIRGEKRKIQDNPPVDKRRKTLFPVENSLDIKKVPYISLSRYVLPVESSKDISLPCKSEFLSLFELSSKENPHQKNTVGPNSTRVIKLQNCPHIPLSSDVGKLLIRKENHNMPDNVIDKKLERLEWYVNKKSPSITNRHYNTTFIPAKSDLSHIYKFPMKQYHQMLGNQKYSQFLMRKCTPLEIVLVNEDLLSLQRQVSPCFGEMKMLKQSETQIYSHTCEQSKHSLNEKVEQKYLKNCVSELKSIKELKVVLINCRK